MPATSLSQEKVQLTSLIKAVRETLNISDSAPAMAEPSLSFGTHKCKRPAATFLYVLFFDDYVYKHWHKPAEPFKLPKRFELRYPFEEALVEKWSSPPVVDPPICRLRQTTVIPIGEPSSFRDPDDRKLERMTCSLFSAAGALFRPILAITLVSQAVTVWSKDLRRGLEESQVPPDYIALVDQMISALQFV